MILGPGDDYAVHHDAGDLDILRIHGVPVGDPLHLRDDEAAAVLRSHRLGQHLDREGFPLHGDVSVRVRRRTPDDGHIERRQPVKKDLPPLDLHQLHQVLPFPFRSLVQLSAVQPGIDEVPRPT